MGKYNNPNRDQRDSKSGPSVDVSDLRDTKFYVDENSGEINKDWIIKIPEKWATLFVQKGMTKTQMRNFYQEARRIKENVEARGLDPVAQFASQKHRLYLMAAKANYQAGRTDRNKYPLEFRDYMITCINRINTYSDFKVFMLSFEALVGYLYGMGGKS